MYNSGTTKGKSPTDVVICGFARTPITRSRKGGFRDTRPDQLLACAVKAAVERSKIDPNKVEEMVYGNTLERGQGTRSWGRMA